VKRGALGCLFELLETLLLTLIVFLTIQLLVAQPYQIEQQSMENTLMPNQYVLVDKLTPRFDDYHRGDIIVFTPPRGSTFADTTPFIKRVIGVAGDTVDIHDGHVFVNGTQLTEPYIFELQPTDPMTDTHSWVVGPGQLFVMGDHREASQDSRVFGPIARSSVIGRAWIRYWPLSAFGMIPSTGQQTDASTATASPATSTSPSASPAG
jgi:signal peptidase I